VADKTLAELQALNAAAKFKDGKYERQVVPTLADVVGLLKNSTVRVEVEIKAPPPGRYVGIEEKLVKEIADRNLFAQVQVSSFNFDVLRDVKRVNPKVKTVALLTSDFFRRVPLDYPAKVVDEAQAMGAEVIAVNKDLLTTDITKEAQNRGVKVEVWTVDGEMEMKKFIELGVDGIITNQPDVLKGLMSKK
jgi:glycerophosphoryl diester phosphodiesterase